MPGGMPATVAATSRRAAMKLTLRQVVRSITTAVTTAISPISGVAVRTPTVSASSGIATNASPKPTVDRTRLAKKMMHNANRIVLRIVSHPTRVFALSYASL